MSLLEAESYINGLSSYIDVDLTKYGIEFLRYIVERFPSLPTPSIGYGEDDVIGFTWRDDIYYVNVELFADRHIELFFENLQRIEIPDLPNAIYVEDSATFDSVAALLSRYF